MEKDFIRWKVGYAEGFDIKEEFISVLSPCALWEFEVLENDEILKPFLLVKAIDGINKQNKKWEIKTSRDYITAYADLICQCSYKTFDIDNARDQILKYIYMCQEKNNGD